MLVQRPFYFEGQKTHTQKKTPVPRIEKYYTYILLSPVFLSPNRNPRHLTQTSLLLSLKQITSPKWSLYNLHLAVFLIVCRNLSYIANASYKHLWVSNCKLGALFLCSTTTAKQNTGRTPDAKKTGFGSSRRIWVPPNSEGKLKLL